MLAAMGEEFNVSSIYLDYWECDKELEVYSTEGMVRLEIPSQIAPFVVKISYSIATSLDGTIFF